MRRLEQELVLGCVLHTLRVGASRTAHPQEKKDFHRGLGNEDYLKPLDFLKKILLQMILLEEKVSNTEQ